MSEANEEWRARAGRAARTLGIQSHQDGLLTCPHAGEAVFLVDVPASGVILEDGDTVYRPTVAIAYLCSLCCSLYKGTAGEPPR